MTLSRFCVAVIIALLPLAALANPGRGEFGRGEQPPWHREAYNPYQMAANGKRWEELSDREREELRRRKAQYESLPRSEQRRLRDAREDYEKMPADRRKAVRERWEKMPADEKRRYRLEKEQRKGKDRD